MNDLPEMDPVFVGTVAYRAIRRFTLGADNDVQSFSRMLHGFTTDKLWQTGWIDESSGRFYQAESLRDFVETHLEVSIAWVYAKLALAAPLDDSKDRLIAAAQVAFDQAITEETGRSPKEWYQEQLIDQAPKLPEHGGAREQADNVSMKQHGNSADYTRKRLKRDRPDLLERVKAGELTLSAAAIQAGFKKKSVSIPEDPQRAAATIVRNFGDEFAMQLVVYLTNEDSYV